MTEAEVDDRLPAAGLPTNGAEVHETEADTHNNNAADVYIPWSNNIWPRRENNLNITVPEMKRNSFSDDEEEEKVKNTLSDIKSDKTWKWKKVCDYLRDDESNLEKQKKKGCGCLRYVAILYVILGTICCLTDTMELLYDHSMNISPGSSYLKIWMEPPITIYAKVYIFNFTNTEEFMSGRAEKLQLDQIGPFVFRENLKHTEVKFNVNGTMTYTPRRTVEFVRELSIADPETMRVNVPNIAYLGLGSMMADASIFANLGLLPTIKYLGSKPFLNLTVQDYLWGYDDPLIEIANTLVSNWITFAKLGLLDRMYDEGDNSITIRLADNGLPIDDPGYIPQYGIDNWNGSPGLNSWGYREKDYHNREDPLRPTPEERCKLIRGASEGTLFPRPLKPEMENYVFRKTFCRHMRIAFKESLSFMPGIQGNMYTPPDNVFDTPENNPEQFCYCDPESEKCLPKGVSDITPCYYNIPAAVSFPHFLNADPALFEKIGGLSPDEELHGSSVIIQPDLGSVVDFQSRMQTNLVMKNIRYNADLVPLRNMIIPFFWVELSTPGIPLQSVISLYVLLVIAPAMVIITIILGAFSAIYFSILGIRCLDRLCSERRSKNKNRVVVVETLEKTFTPKYVHSSPG